jgi:PAS domain S-box-containing protein
MSAAKQHPGEEDLLETINRLGQTMAAELDLKRLLQMVTDAATGLTGAQFGAFFYNVVREHAESYMLYTLSGVPPEAFSKFPMPRNTAIFGPTFAGEGVVRLSDVRKDPRYGQNAPYHGMPAGHLPVVSYLAVPVVSRSGEVLGGLFFGHEKEAVFGEREERLVSGLAGHAAIAIDNARLFEQLQEERERYRLVTEVVPQMVWTADPDGMLDYANARWTEYTGQSVADMKDTGWKAVLHPEDEKRALALWQQATESATAFEVECRLKRADGAYRWHISRAEPQRDALGHVVKWFGTCTDIHDQKSAERSARFLAAAGQILGASLETGQTLEAVARLAVSEIADWAAFDLLQPGLTLERVVLAAADPVDEQLAHELDRRYRDKRSPRSAVSRVIATGRAERYAEVTEEALEASSVDAAHLRGLLDLGLRSAMVVPLIARGRTFGALSLATSRSGRAFGPREFALGDELALRAAVALDNGQLFREAEEARRASEQANRMKDEFLATLSHELRTPLNAIVGWSHMLRGEGLDAATTRKGLESIARNAQVQTQLIADILDVSRIVAGKLRLEVQPTDLVSVVNAALDTVRPTAEARGIRLQPVFDGQPAEVTGDPDRLQQVLWNLLANAVKFVPRGGRVQVRLRTVNSHVEITVADDGPGIRPELLPHIFERFRQGDSSSVRHHGGLGLGLAIVRHLVEMHGGTVVAENSATGTGAVFTVRLPRRTVDAGTAIAPGGARIVLPAVDVAGVRVLLVDDDVEGREVAQTVLQTAGAVVRAAGSAADAFALARGGPSDVLLADIEMPGDDGYVLLSRLRALGGPWASLPAAALTAYASPDARTKALRAGFRLHVPKPVAPTELLAVVASLAGRT